jgi:hypothetical protein
VCERKVDSDDKGKNAYGSQEIYMCNITLETQHKCEDNIKIGISEVGRKVGGVDWIHLAENLV